LDAATSSESDSKSEAGKVTDLYFFFSFFVFSLYLFSARFLVYVNVCKGTGRL
jgi:hypothetical protein